MIGIDIWEHVRSYFCLVWACVDTVWQAFYLQYKNVKADYVKAVWNVFNWEDVAARYAAATA